MGEPETKPEIEEDVPVAERKAIDILCYGYDGNEPLITRVVILEKSLAECVTDVNKLKEDNVQLRIEDKKAKWHFFLLLSIAILGWVSALVTGLDSAILFQFLTTLGRVL